MNENYDLEKYKLIGNAAGIAYWQMDIEEGDPVNPNNRLSWSKEFREMKGIFSEKELPEVFSDLSAVLHKDDYDKTVEGLVSHVSDNTGKTPFDLEYRVMIRTGEYCYFRVFGAALRDANGTPLQMVGAFADVTDNRKEEEDYRSNMVVIGKLFHWYETILDAIPLAIMAQDVDERITFINKAAEEFLGKRREDVLGTPCRNSDLKICNTKNCAIACAKRGLKGTTLRRNKLSYKISVETLKDTDDSIVGYIEAIQDVTEVETLARQKADAENHAKSDFLATMSHEIRTPLNAIVGMTQIGRKSRDTERKDYAFGRIMEASEHLLGVISDILDMSKINANKVELSHVKFCFKRMIEKVVMIVAPRIEEQEQQLTVNIADNIPRYVVGDDQHLSQVVANLLSNSAKFTRNKGKIGLDITLYSELDGICTLKFVVSDTGIGIAPEQQDRLFNYFEQAESGIKREFGGTGLGLAISKNLIELMDGEIHVVSELGQGSRFIFTVKVERAEPEPSAAGLSEASETAEDGANAENSAQNGDFLPNNIFAGKTLLIVDDVEINREIIASLLENTGVQIDCAEDGEQAVRASVRRPAYDVILMDVHMPKMDGLEATRKIRESCKTSIIIAMTANVFKDNIASCLEAGMDDHITKPLDVNKFFAKMRKYLET